MDKITEALGRVKTMAPMNLFPQVTNYSNILQPEGEVDLLIGIHCIKIQPSLITCCGNLGLYSLMYGTGYILGGSHPSIKVTGTQGLPKGAKEIT